MLRLQSNSNWQVRKTLREICEAAQRGQRIPPQKVAGFVATIKGLYAETRLGKDNFPDVEVDRWILKAIIEIGSNADFVWFSEKARNCSDEENCLWIAVGLLKFSSGRRDLSNEFRRLGLDANRYNIAACMAKRPDLLEMASGLKIENAARIELLISCVAFAIGRDLGAIFDPRFSQTSQLTALNEHHDELVRQYSVYAMWRLPDVEFGMSPLGLSDISSQVISVRRWLYELVLKSSYAVRKHMDFWREVAENEHDEEALEGFVNGLFPHFVDGLSDITLGLLEANRSQRVRLALLRHICRNSDEDSSYREIAVEEFRSAVKGSLERAVCLDAAGGTQLFGDLKRIEAADSVPDLFSTGEIIMGDKITIGSVQTFSKGDNNTVNSGDWLQQVQGAYGDIDRMIDLLDRSGGDKAVDEAKAALVQLREKPSKTALEKAVETLKLLASGATSVAAISTMAGPLITHLQSLL